MAVLGYECLRCGRSFDTLESAIQHALVDHASEPGETRLSYIQGEDKEPRWGMALLISVLVGLCFWSALIAVVAWLMGP